jgi:hypothetical protein
VGGNPAWGGGALGDRPVDLSLPRGNAPVGPADGDETGERRDQDSREQTGDQGTAEDLVAWEKAPRLLQEHNRREAAEHAAEHAEDGEARPPVHALQANSGPAGRGATGHRRRRQDQRR